jgi:UDP-N-acetylmuramoyl-tripeptide--D-alanyl-D-alanine ligase
MKCAVEALLDERAFPQGKKTIVLGEMAELGENSELMHKQTGEWLRSKRFETLITVGAKASVIAAGAHGGRFNIIECADQSEARQHLQRDLSSDRCIMIKGSHCANLDKLVHDLAQSS